MTEPDVSHDKEDFGSLEIFGIPFSTFTRTVTLGLEELGLGDHYIQHETEPHSAEVVKRNPFGLLPVLVHRPDAIYTRAQDAVILYESNAIRRYIDDWVAPLAHKKFGHDISLTPSLSSNNGHRGPLHNFLGSSGPSSSQRDSTGDFRAAAARARVDQWVSIASTILFPAVELGVVKPRLALERNGADDATITVAIEDGILRLHDRLTKIEQDLLSSNDGPYLCGANITWADLFVYPPLADLRAVPEGHAVSGKDAKFPMLSAWLDRMEARGCAKNTFVGTLASQR